MSGSLIFGQLNLNINNLRICSIYVWLLAPDASAAIVRASLGYDRSNMSSDRLSPICVSIRRAHSQSEIAQRLGRFRLTNGLHQPDGHKTTSQTHACDVRTHVVRVCRIAHKQILECFSSYLHVRHSTPRRYSIRPFHKSMINMLHHITLKHCFFFHPQLCASQTPSIIQCILMLQPWEERTTNQTYLG